MSEVETVNRPTDEAGIRSLFDKLRALKRPDGSHVYGQQEALDLALGTAAPRRAKHGKVASFVGGVAQGASFDMADEVAGAVGAVVNRDPGKTLAQNYQANRDNARARLDELEADNRGVSMAGKLLGGVATGVVAGAPATLGKAIVAGAGYGAAGAVGSSRADLVEGDVGGVAKDAAVGGTIGTVLAPVSHYAPRVVGNIVDRFRGAKGGAATVARGIADVADEPSAIGGGSSRGFQTIKSAAERGLELQQRVRAIDESFRLRPSQLTGDPAQALLESKSSQFAGTMRAVQAQEAAQKRIGARYLDSMVDHIAADPAKLGRRDVSDNVAKVIGSELSSLRKERSAVAGPLFADARSANGGARIAKTDKVSATLARLADDYVGSSASIGSALRADLAYITEGGTAKGSIDIGKFQGLMEYWGKRAAGDIEMPGLSPDASRRVAGEVLGALRADLDATVASAQGKAGGESLKAARDMWAAYSDDIDRLSTDTVKRILKLSDGDNTDSVVKKIMGGSEEQIEGVFRLLNKNPEAASQLRAQMLDELFVSFGKPRLRGVSPAADSGAAHLMPGKGLAAMANPEIERRYMASFAGDEKAMFAYRESMELLQRLAFGPNLKGSQTAPLAGVAVDEALSRFAGPAGTAARPVVDWLRATLGAGRNVGRMLSTTEGLDTFAAALKAVAGRKRIDSKAAGAIMASVSRLGIEAIDESSQGAYGATPTQE